MGTGKGRLSLRLALLLGGVSVALGRGGGEETVAGALSRGGGGVKFKGGASRPRTCAGAVMAPERSTSRPTCLWSASAKSSMATSLSMPCGRPAGVWVWGGGSRGGAGGGQGRGGGDACQLYGLSLYARGTEAAVTGTPATAACMCCSGGRRSLSSITGGMCVPSW